MEEKNEEYSQFSISSQEEFEMKYVLMLEDAAKSIESSLRKIDRLDKFVSYYKTKFIESNDVFQLKESNVEVEIKTECICNNIEYNTQINETETVPEKQLLNDNNHEKILNISGSYNCVAQESNSSLNELTVNGSYLSDISDRLSNKDESYIEDSRREIHKKQLLYEVYVDNLHNRVTKEELSEVLLKQGFENFDVIVKNRPTHSFAFVKFATKEICLRAVERSKNMFCGGKQIKMRECGERRNKPSVKHISDERDRQNQSVGNFRRDRNRDYHLDIQKKRSIQDRLDRDKNYHVRDSRRRLSSSRNTKKR